MRPPHALTLTPRRHDMARQTKPHRFLAIVLVAGLIGGCASAGTARKLTAADTNLLPGQWTGTVNPPGGSSMLPGTLTIKPDMTYSTEAGAFSSTGKIDIKDGYVHFVSTGGTGALGAGERTGTATLMDRGTRWGLAGSGYASVAGPFNFDFSKAK